MVFFMHTSQGLLAQTRISLLTFPSLSFSEFVTIKDSIDIITSLMESQYVIKRN